jgi:hypothetical protein
MSALQSFRGSGHGRDLFPQHTIHPNNARQGYVDLRIDTLKLAGYFFGSRA